MFELHPTLAAGSVAVTRLSLCELRLINDRRFIWLILVPQRPRLTELHQLSESEQQQLLAASGQVSRLIEGYFAVDKLNVGALGNVVPQLHWHIVGRRRDDPCWPGPVWGCASGEPYPSGELERVIATLLEGIEVER